MGGSTSIFENSRQETNTRVAQISNENCVNACIENNNSLDIVVNNSVINGDITYTERCLISGAGCTLKSSLDSTLINTQTSEQDASINEEEDPFTLLNQLFDIGSSDKINENNFQSISNEVTQIMNSTCQNNTEVSNNSLAVFINSSTINGEINLTESGSVSNTQCILNNMSKSYVKNDQKNTQKASISKGSCLAGLGGLGGILIIFIILKLFHSNHAQQKIIVKEDNQKQATPTNQATSAKTEEPKKKSIL